VKTQNKGVPQAILFDLDDTIITWDAPPEEVWGNLCLYYASRVDNLEAGKLLEAINGVREWYWSDSGRHRTGRINLLEARREIVRLAFSRLNIDASVLADEIADAYTANREKSAYIVPGAAATFKHLRQRGIRLALVTNGGSEMQRPKIQRFGLAPFFDSIIIEGEFGCGKPDKRVFLHALGKLNVLPENAWMVGDDLERDISPCRVLGIYSVWVDGKGKGLPVSGIVRPDRIIRNIAELKEAA
jgi:putative hydrolase of the HAD superfamily